MISIRFAAPPIGALRWQAPQPPIVNRTATIQANRFASQCPQTSLSGPNRPSILANEDCLFLNVYSPPGAKNLPVFVYIHGGGYGLGNAYNQDLSTLIATNNNSFVGVTIQYRLGAFGFLSSDEVFRMGAVNAGLLDQTFALHWVQQYIGLFGGNASQVTIAGESAGAGSVMLQTMAYGGTLGTSLFTNAIAASVYLPYQYGYRDWQPSQSYYSFASWAGCMPNQAYGGSNTTIFECLQAANTTTLQYASFNVSMSGRYGSWGFVPVTDGVFIQQQPSQQLLEKRINGRHMLVGNNASKSSSISIYRTAEQDSYWYYTTDEAPAYTQPNITTEPGLLAWLQLTFPLFTNDDIAKVLLYYPSTNASVNPADPTFATLGDSGPSAINVSSFATGQQQRADVSYPPSSSVGWSLTHIQNIFAESTFTCPGYWLSQGFSDKGRSSYKYQYSVPAGQHAADLTAYFGPPKVNQGPDFVRAFQSEYFVFQSSITQPLIRFEAIWGNFITSSNPSINAYIANGANSSTPNAANSASDWPQFNTYAPYMLNLNETGGTPYVASGLLNGVTANATQYMGPGLMNNITLANAYTWEAGRGYRCDFWRSVAYIMPSWILFCLLDYLVYRY